MIRWRRLLFANYFSSLASRRKPSSSLATSYPALTKRRARSSSGLRVAVLKSVIIPTELFPARRVRWIFRHEAAPAGVRIIVHAIIKPPGYGVENWWEEESGPKDFKNEVIKFAYYRLKY